MTARWPQLLRSPDLCVCGHCVSYQLVLGSGSETHMQAHSQGCGPWAEMAASLGNWLRDFLSPARQTPRSPPLSLAQRWDLLCDWLAFSIFSVFFMCFHLLIFCAFPLVLASPWPWIHAGHFPRLVSQSLQQLHV